MGKRNQYKIEHKISTLIHCAIFKDKDKPASFEIDGIKFSHTDFNYRDGWEKDEWAASAIFEEQDWLMAINNFRKSLSKIIPKISFISQAYIEYRLQPYLVHKLDDNRAFIRYTSDSDPVGLMFMDNEMKALAELAKDSKIPLEFYLYWNDAVNAAGYSAKLLLMFSAIEALTKKPNGDPDYNYREEILGKDLKVEIFGKKGDSDNALRNRLVHGEYFNNDDQQNYVEEIHKRIINYFNTNHLSESFINEDVKNPQRHFFGNFKSCEGFIERVDGSNSFELNDILVNFENNGIEKPIKYRVFNDVENY